MESDSLFAWLGIILAGLVMAFAAAAEVSLGDISRANVRRLREEGLPRAQALQTLLDDPPRFVTAMMVLQAMAFVAVSGLSHLAIFAGRPGMGMGRAHLATDRSFLPSGRSSSRQSVGHARA